MFRNGICCEGSCYLTMEEGTKSKDHLISAAAFVEGGTQDACDDACSICLEAFSENDPHTVHIWSYRYNMSFSFYFIPSVIFFIFSSCRLQVASTNFIFSAFLNGNLNCVLLYLQVKGFSRILTCMDI